MRYYIETAVKGVKYWLKVSYGQHGWVNYTLEGLRDNATGFPTKDLANETLYKIITNLPLTVTTKK